MIIKRYEIELHSLTEEHLELVRNWRNQDFVRLHMDYKEVISEEEQKKWFNTLPLYTNLYFIISTQQKPIGLINLKNINWEHGHAEAGIFIGDSNYLNSVYPVMAALCLYQFSFDKLQLKRVYAKIENHNPKTLAFNNALGYETSKTFTSKGFSYFELSDFNFKDKTNKLNYTLEKLYGDTFEINVNPEEPMHSILSHKNKPLA